MPLGRIGRKLARVFFKTGGAEYPGEGPLSSTQSADEGAPGSLRQRAFPPRRDPRRSTAEGTLPPPVQAVRWNHGDSQHLDVGAKDRSREVVVPRRRVAAPIDEQPRARRGGEIGLSRASDFGERLRAGLRCKARDPPDLFEKA